MKRVILATLLLMLAVRPALAEDKYVFILKALGNGYWLALKQGIEDASKKAGVVPVIMSPANDLMKEENLRPCSNRGQIC